MSYRSRVSLGCVVGVLWAGWLVIKWMTVAAHYQVPVIQMVGEESLMLAAGLATVGLFIGMAISPMIRTMRIWMKVGERMQCQSCECGDQPKKAVGAVVIPIRPVKRDVFSDS